jgi:GTPase SAR1 family protein
LIYFPIGNKIDREDREIPTEVGEEFSQRHGMYFLETSAKASDNVERLFTEIAQDLLQVLSFNLKRGWQL